MIRVLFFGPVAERAGQRVIEVEYRPGLKLQDLYDALSQQYPLVFDIVSFIAVNGMQARDFSTPLADASEVAFMAKFSGG